MCIYMCVCGVRVCARARSYKTCKQKVYKGCENLLSQSAIFAHMKWLFRICPFRRKIVRYYLGNAIACWLWIILHICMQYMCTYIHMCACIGSLMEVHVLVTSKVIAGRHVFIYI